MFFALQNQSMAQKRMDDAEQNMRDLWKKCGDLTLVTENLDSKIKVTRKDLDLQHSNFFQKFNDQVNDFEEKFGKHHKRIFHCSELLEAHGLKHDSILNF